jgi:arsenite methyltransferase
MSMTQASSQYFQQVAGEWDNLRAGFFGESVRESAVQKAYLRPEMVVADVGSGTGFIAAALAPLVRRVYVTDGSPEMLAVARQNLAQFDNLEFHLADGQQLPFPDESLDAVFANMYLHHAPDPLAAIREMVRVLRPGGRLVITDMDTHPYAWLKEEMADVWQGFERDQLHAWYAEAGLVNVLVDCTGQSCCAESKTEQAEDQRQATISVFVATGTRRMAAHESVQQRYGEYARGGTCGCGQSGGAVDRGGAEASSAESSCCGSQSTTAAAESSCCGSQSTTAAANTSCCGSQSTDAAANTSCCGEVSRESAGLAIGYSSAELSAVPSEAAEIPLGCGNPVAIANLRPGEVVVDIGSGGGLDSFLAAGRVGPDGQVIGVDMTLAMLERARAAAARAGITNVEFRQGFAEQLPLEDASTDVILSNCVINLTEDKGRVFREAFRVLRPGGRLEVSDIVAGGGLPLEAREDSGGWAACVTGALPEREYLDLIVQAGFEQVQVRRSPSTDEVAGVPVYSAIVSARKP